MITLEEGDIFIFIFNVFYCRLNIEITDPRVKKHTSKGTKLEAALIVKNILR